MQCDEESTAGWRFIQNLDREFGGNIYVMYVGYNSGPLSARRLWKAIGRKPGANLAQAREDIFRGL